MRSSYSFIVDVCHYLLLWHGTVLLAVVAVSHGVPHGVPGGVAGHPVPIVLGGLHMVVVFTVLEVTTLAVLITRRELWVWGDPIRPGVHEEWTHDLEGRGEKWLLLAHCVDCVDWRQVRWRWCPPCWGERRHRTAGLSCEHWNDGWTQTQSSGPATLLYRPALRGSEERPTQKNWRSLHRLQTCLHLSHYSCQAVHQHRHGWEEPSRLLIIDCLMSWTLMTAIVITLISSHRPVGLSLLSPTGDWLRN